MQKSQRKAAIWSIIICLFFTQSPGAAPREVDIMYLNNSLTTGAICNFWPSDMLSYMINMYSDIIGLIYYPEKCGRGASSIRFHWQNQDGVANFDNPTVWNGQKWQEQPCVRHSLQ